MLPKNEGEQSFKIQISYKKKKRMFLGKVGVSAVHLLSGFEGHID